MARKGPKPKGDRTQLTFRLERRHRQQYEQEAARRGLPLGDYIALMLARGHQLDEPEYLHRGRTHDQQELAMGA